MKPKIYNELTKDYSTFKDKIDHIYHILEKDDTNNALLDRDYKKIILKIPNGELYNQEDLKIFVSYSSDTKVKSFKIIENNSVYVYNFKNSYLTNLYKIRTSLKLSQNKMARILNIHHLSYIKYENEINDIPLNTLYTISDIFDVSIDYILG